MNDFLDNINGCIAYPCTAPRVKNSGFCEVHKAEHEASTYPALLKALMGGKE